MSAKNAGWSITQTLSSCDSSRGRARSDCRSDEVHESSFPYLTPQCWQVSEDAVAKCSTVWLSHWDEHVELLAGVTQHHCFQLVHDACCPAGRCGIWFEWVRFQVFHNISENSLCLIPCLRPEWIGAECCDIHAVLGPPSALDWRYTAALFPVDTWRVLPRSWSLWNLVCQSSTHLRCDFLIPHFVRLRACVLSWFVLNVVTFMQFLCRSQRHSLRADCGISQVL